MDAFNYSVVATRLLTMYANPHNRVCSSGYFTIKMIIFTALASDESSGMTAVNGEVCPTSLTLGAR